MTTRPTTRPPWPRGEHRWTRVAPPCAGDPVIPSLPIRRRRLAWSLARGMAAVGVAVVVVAECPTRIVNVRLPAVCVGVAITPRFVNVQAWPSTAIDPAAHYTPAWAWGRGSFETLTTTDRDRPDPRRGTLAAAAWTFGYPVFEILGGTPDGAGFGLYGVQLPTWFAVAVLLAPLAMLTVRRQRRCRQDARGLRRICWYDLRATPGRCPECGAAVGDRRGVADG